MTTPRSFMRRPALVSSSLVVLGAMSTVAVAGDLSRYRAFQFGTDLATVARQAGTDPSLAKAVHSRPALIQELLWRPQPLGPSDSTESAQEVVFSFFNGELFRIAVHYDRYATEGLTTKDMIEFLTTAYGVASASAAPTNTTEALYGDQETVLARWQDPQYRFDLTRSSYGPTFTLIGVHTVLEGRAKAAALEAARLDEQEEPQREAARMAVDDEATRSRLEKARTTNMPKFRP